jgi:hypothetical protein
VGKNVYDYFTTGDGRDHVFEIQIAGWKGKTQTMANLLEDSYKYTIPSKLKPEYTLSNYTKKERDIIVDHLGPMSITESVNNSFKESMGTVLVNGMLKKDVEEKEQISAGFIPAYHLGDKDADEKRAVNDMLKKRTFIPTKTISETRIGKYDVVVVKSELKIYFRCKPGSQRSYQTAQPMDIGMMHDYEFVLVDSISDTVIRRWDLCWHPFWSWKISYKLFMAFTGIQKAGGSVGTRREMLRKLTPRHNPLIQATSVIEFLRDYHRDVRNRGEKSQFGARDYLRGMGFTTAEEINDALQAYEESDLLEDVQELDEYASTPDFIKSSARERLDELLSLDSVLSSQTRADLQSARGANSALTRLFATFLYAEFNAFGCTAEPYIFKKMENYEDADVSKHGHLLAVVPKFVLQKVHD